MAEAMASAKFGKLESRYFLLHFLIIFLASFPPTTLSSHTQVQCRSPTASNSDLALLRINASS